MSMEDLIIIFFQFSSTMAKHLFLERRLGTRLCLHATFRFSEISVFFKIVQQLVKQLIHSVFDDNKLDLGKLSKKGTKISKYFVTGCTISLHKKNFFFKCGEIRSLENFIFCAVFVSQ